MEESKALNKLSEAADLVAMVEELLAPATVERLSATSVSGIRITLRGIREAIASSQSVLTNELIARARASTSTISNSNTIQSTSSQAAATNGQAEFTSGRSDQRALLTQADAQKGQPARRDLKSSIERIVDR